MTDERDWSVPVEVTDVQMTFPADAEDYMPSREFCEAELDKLSPAERNVWRNFQSTWFFNGLPETTSVDLNEGVDGVKAFRHLKAIQGSFAPKHEHKEAAVAYLASRFFDNVTYDGEKWEIDRG